MIRSARKPPSLFYSHEDLSKAPRKTFYDRLSALNLDWEELSSGVSKSFSPFRNGRPTDSVLYFKCFLVGYLEGIECDTELADRLSDSLAIRGFLFGSLVGTPPDHSSLSRVRQRVVEEGDLDDLLKKSVELLAAAGLIGTESASVDTALIPSRARRLRVDEDGHSAYDPEAQVVSKPNYPAAPSYKVPLTVDNSSRAVLACDALPAKTGEGAAARASLTEAVRNLGGECPTYVVADKGMDDSSFHAHVEFFGGIPVTPLQIRNGKKSSGFGKERFLYDSQRDIYICPAGEVLNRVSEELAERVTYRSNSKVCASCPLRMYCHGDSKKVKQLSRSCTESSRERVRVRGKEPKIRKLLAYRKAKVEPVFSDFKELGGLSEIWTKGLGPARVKAKMAAVGWNLKLLLKAVEKGKAVLPRTPQAPKAPDRTKKPCRELLQTILALLNHSFPFKTRPQTA